MCALKVIIVGAGSSGLASLRRILDASSAHCAVVVSSDAPVVDVEPSKPAIEKIIASANDFTPKYARVLAKEKEPWRKGRPLK